MSTEGHMGATRCDRHCHFWTFSCASYCLMAYSGAEESPSLVGKSSVCSLEVCILICPKEFRKTGSSSRSLAFKGFSDEHPKTLFWIPEVK